MSDRLRIFLLLAPALTVIVVLFGGGLAVVAGRHPLLQEHHRQRIARPLAVGTHVPIGEQFLPGGEIGRFGQIEPGHRVEHPADIARAFVAGVELDRIQFAPPDRVRCRQQPFGAARTVGLVELDSEGAL